MKIFDTLIGNEEIKGTLGSSIINSNFSHAYIIEGEKGTGKKTVAKLASAAIICKNQFSRPCGTCPSCIKILNDSYADVKLFDITKVDSIREIKQKLYDSPAEGDFKIYIFNDAQKMTVKAQNALLISLEEPPKNVVFFILTTDAGALLETIRSRAQILRTQRLDNDTIFNYLKNTDGISLPDKKLQEIVIASAGSLGYALDMSSDKKSEALISLRKKALDFTLAALKNDAEAVTLLYSMSSMSRDDLKDLLSLSITVLGDLIIFKKDKSAKLFFFTSATEASQICAKYNLQKMLSCYDAFLRAREDLLSNSNTSITLMSILINSKKKGS